MEKAQIRQILNNSRYFKIPFFQRSYVWSEENWDRFLEDMKVVSATPSPFFLGAYIAKIELTNSNEEIGDVRVLIDGQQRFTTILLFFYTLCKKLDKTRLFEQWFFVTSSKHDICLQHNHNDKEIFDAIVTGQLTPALRKKYAKNKVLLAYNFFDENIDIQDFDLNVLLNSLYFVPIDLSPDEDEQQIFDTINSLGVKLTIGDLLKNFLFSDTDDYKLYEKTWKEIFEKDQDTQEFWSADVTSGRQKRTNIDMFLQAYLTIKSTSDFSLNSLFSAFKKYLKEQHFEENKEEIVNDIIEYAKLYRKHFDPEVLNTSLGNTVSSIKRLNIIFWGLEITTFIPYCLFILREQEDNEQEASAIFEYLEKYLMRRLICKWDTKYYNQLCQKFIRNRVITLDELIKGISNIENDYYINMPKDLDIRKAIDEYDLTNKQSLGILFLLELHLREEKDSTQLLVFKDYELEHIMPKKWQQYWPLIGDNTEDNRKKHIGLLGNKTILNGKLNNAIKNASWDIKKEGKPEHPGLQKCARDLKTFQFEDIEVWNEEKIEERNDQLYQQICQVWPENK